LIRDHLGKYCEHLEVPEYRHYLDDDEPGEMRKFYVDKDIEGFTPDQISAMSDEEIVANFCKSWHGREGYIEWVAVQDKKRFFVLTTYNKDSKWDWCTVGGRYSGMLNFVEYPRLLDERRSRTWTRDDNSGCNITRVRDVFDSIEAMEKCTYPKVAERWAEFKKDWNLKDGEIPMPFCIIGPDLSWHERATMLWFGCTKDEKEDWRKQAEAYLRQFRDHVVVNVDFHI
jgi:hypothetical protein